MYCGIRLTDKNRDRNMCTTCAARDGWDGICTMCTTHVNKARYLNHGNWCQKCEHKALKVSEPRETRKDFEGRQYISNIVRQRDNFTCVDCGSVQSKFDKRGFPVVYRDATKQQRFLSVREVPKLVTLCRKCMNKRLIHR